MGTPRSSGCFSQYSSRISSSSWWTRGRHHVTVSTCAMLGLDGGSFLLTAELLIRRLTTRFDTWGTSLHHICEVVGLHHKTEVMRYNIAFRRLYPSVAAVRRWWGADLGAA